MSHRQSSEFIIKTMCKVAVEKTRNEWALHRKREENKTLKKIFRLSRSNWKSLQHVCKFIFHYKISHTAKSKRVVKKNVKNSSWQIGKFTHNGTYETLEQVGTVKGHREWCFTVNYFMTQWKLKASSRIGEVNACKKKITHLHRINLFVLSIECLWIFVKK